MKGKRKILLAIAALGLPLMGGCVTQSDFTVLSTKNVNLSNFSTDAVPGAPKATGVDSKWIIVGVPLGYANIKEAADRAEESANADALVNVRLKFTYWDALVVGQTKAEVSGNPVAR
jgi:hypothetical protein